MTESTGKASPPWLPAEDEKLLAICAEKQIVGPAAWAEVAESFYQRTPCALRQHYLALRNKAKGKTEKEIRNQQRAKICATRQATMQDPIVPHARPQHASLTAAVFGDPLPGRSALDRRGAGAC